MFNLPLVLECTPEEANGHIDVRERNFDSRLLSQFSQAELPLHSLGMSHVNSLLPSRSQRSPILSTSRLRITSWLTHERPRPARPSRSALHERF